MKRALVFLALASLLLVGGCGQSQENQVIKADPLAASDPDAKARQLMQQFTDAEDQKTWVQQNSFALSVFQTVKDPQLKADYESKIAPMMK